MSLGLLLVWDYVCMFISSNPLLRPCSLAGFVMSSTLCAKTTSSMPLPLPLLSCAHDTLATRNARLSHLYLPILVKVHPNVAHTKSLSLSSPSTHPWSPSPLISGHLGNLPHGYCILLGIALICIFYTVSSLRAGPGFGRTLLSESPDTVPCIWRYLLFVWNMSL